MHRVERLSIREIGRRTGMHRKTIRRALASETPPEYSGAPAGSKLDPFRDWICEQLRADPAIQSLRLREMAVDLGYEGGKRSSMTTCARSAPGSSCGGRSSARSIGPASWCSAICGSRATRCRSGMGRPAVGGS